MFSIHGDWEIEVCGNVVIQWFSGGWNEEAVISYVNEFRSKVTALLNNEWAILSIFEDWELGIPEITKHVEEHCIWFKSHGCVKDCHVYTPSATKKMQLESLVPQTDEHYERHVFTHIHEALAWLASYGFCAENSRIVNALKK